FVGRQAIARREIAGGDVVDAAIRSLVNHQFVNGGRRRRCLGGRRLRRGSRNDLLTVSHRGYGSSEENPQPAAEVDGKGTHDTTLSCNEAPRCGLMKEIRLTLIVSRRRMRVEAISRFLSSRTCLFREPSFALSAKPQAIHHRRGGGVALELRIGGGEPPPTRIDALHNRQDTTLFRSCSSTSMNLRHFGLGH